MDSSSAAMKRETRGVAIPSQWRALQGILTALLALIAGYYALQGWKAPAGETGLAAAFRPIDLAGFAVLIGLVWLTTPSAFVIARTTFQEALRRRWMLGMLGFGAVLLLLSTLFTWMQPGAERNILRDIGLGFIIIITMLMAIFLGVALVPPEIERRTIFTVLSKPVDRLEFLIGKFLGLCFTLLVNMAIMSLLFLAVYAVVMIRREGYAKAMEVVMPTHPGLAFDLVNLAKALALQYSEIVVMAALALALSLFLSNMVAIITAFLVYFGGQMAAYWEHMRQNNARIDVAAPLQAIFTGFYYLLPKFDKFDVRERIVNGMPIAMNYWWPSFGSGLVYAAVLLAIAYVFFSDREF